MSDQVRLSELLLQWEEARDKGRAVPPEELCADRPELLPKLKQQIAALDEMDPVLKMDRSAPALVAASVSTGHSSEIQRMLRTRLRIAGTIFVVGCLISTLLAKFDEAFLAGLQWYDLLPMYVMLAATAGLVALLFSVRQLSLPQLRTIEVLIFALACAMITCGQHRWFLTDWLNDIPQPGQERKLTFLLTDSLAAPWIIVIVLYGMFIPNTWKRCALITGLMWLAPLGLILFHGLQNERFGRFLLTDVILGLSVGLGFAMAIAIWGCYKIGVLQQEAFAARRLGQYTLRRLIGKGGMGEVYLAEHQLLRRPCAIKLIHPEQADRRTRKRFEREVRAMATLTNPNTVAVYDYGHAADGTFYYAMEYLPGMTLQEIVDNYGPLPPARAVHLLRQVCQALNEAHSIGLIHRDIKPSNVLVGERGGVYDVAKLLDFGLVKPAQESLSSGRLTLEGVVPGTPLYMSPEQAADLQFIDKRSDLSSLGAVAYFLLAGRPPFQSESVMQLFASHMRDPVRPLRQIRSEVPAGLEAVVMKCLEKNPERRFPDAKSLEKAFAECDCEEAWTQADAERWWKENRKPKEQITSNGSAAAEETVGG